MTSLGVPLEGTVRLRGLSQEIDHAVVLGVVVLMGDVFPVTLTGLACGDHLGSSRVTTGSAVDLLRLAVILRLRLGPGCWCLTVLRH